MEVTARPRKKQKQPEEERGTKIVSEKDTILSNTIHDLLKAIKQSTYKYGKPAQLPHPILIYLDANRYLDTLTGLMRKLDFKYQQNSATMTSDPSPRLFIYAALVDYPKLLILACFLALNSELLGSRDSPNTPNRKEYTLPDRNLLELNVSRLRAVQIIDLLKTNYSELALPDTDALNENAYYVIEALKSVITNPQAMGVLSLVTKDYPFAARLWREEDVTWSEMIRKKTTPPPCSLFYDALRSKKGTGKGHSEEGLRCQTQVFTVYATYAILIEDPRFETLLHNYLHGGREEPDSLTLLYDAVLPFYRERESGMTSQYEMWRDFCTILLEQERRYGTVRGYLQALAMRHRNKGPISFELSVFAGLEEIMGVALGKLFRYQEERQYLPQATQSALAGVTPYLFYYAEDVLYPQLARNGRLRLINRLHASPSYDSISPQKYEMLREVLAESPRFRQSAVDDEELLAESFTSVTPMGPSAQTLLGKESSESVLAATREEDTQWLREAIETLVGRDPAVASHRVILANLLEEMIKRGDSMDKDYMSLYHRHIAPAPGLLPKNDLSYDRALIEAAQSYEELFIRGATGPTSHMRLVQQRYACYAHQFARHFRETNGPLWLEPGDNLQRGMVLKTRCIYQEVKHPVRMENVAMLKAYYGGNALLLYCHERKKAVDTRREFILVNRTERKDESTEWGRVCAFDLLDTTREEDTRTLHMPDNTPKDQAHAEVVFVEVIDSDGSSRVLNAFYEKSIFTVPASDEAEKILRTLRERYPKAVIHTARYDIYVIISVRDREFDPRLFNRLSVSVKRFGAVTPMLPSTPSTVQKQPNLPRSKEPVRARVMTVEEREELSAYQTQVAYAYELLKTAWLIQNLPLEETDLLKVIAEGIRTGGLLLQYGLQPIAVQPFFQRQYGLKLAEAIRLGEDLSAKHMDEIRGSLIEEYIRVFLPA